MKGITALKYDQIVGRRKINIVRKMGLGAGITDYANYLGVDPDPEYVSPDYWKGDVSLREVRAGSYFGGFIDSDFNKNTANVIGVDGRVYFTDCMDTTIGIRMVLPLMPELVNNILRNDDGILECYFGELPTNLNSLSLQEELEDVYMNNRDKMCLSNDTYSSFKEGKIVGNRAICYDGKKYVRVLLDQDRSFTIGDYKKGSFVWFEVRPVRYIIDEDARVMISRDIVLGSIPFNSNRADTYDGTTFNMFLNNIILPEMLTDNERELVNLFGEDVFKYQSFVFDDKDTIIKKLSRGIRKKTNKDK